MHHIWAATFLLFYITWYMLCSLGYGSMIIDLFYDSVYYVPLFWTNSSTVINGILCCVIKLSQQDSYSLKIICMRLRGYNSKFLQGNFTSIYGIFLFSWIFLKIWSFLLAYEVRNRSCHIFKKTLVNLL